MYKFMIIEKKPDVELEYNNWREQLLFVYDPYRDFLVALDTGILPYGSGRIMVDIHNLEHTGNYVNLIREIKRLGVDNFDITLIAQQ